MRKIIYVLALFVALFIVSSCSTSDDCSPVLQSESVSSVPSMSLMDPSVSVYETVFPEFASEKKPMDSLEVQKKIDWEGVFLQDGRDALTGLCEGASFGINFGSYIGPFKAAFIGGAIGAVVYGATGSIFAASSGCAITGPISSGPEVYVKYPNLVNYEVPFNENYIAYDGVDASELGVLHNKVIISLLNEHSLDKLVNLSAEERLDMVAYYAKRDYDIVLSDEGKKILLDSSVTTKYDAFAQNVLYEYFEGLSMLHGSLLFSYSKQFMEAQMRKTLENKDYETMAYIVNGAISVYVNSKVLWNTYVPDPQIARRFIGCDMNGKWRLMNIDELAMRIQSEEIILYGIPKMKNGKVTGIFFYEELWENYDMESEICKNIFENKNFIFDGADFEMLVDGVVANEGNYEVYETEHLYSGKTHFILFE